jgi:carboxyl-terminal processing protease
MSVTLTAMVASLRDDHAQWVHGGGGAHDLGFEANVFGPQITASPGSVVPPLYVARIFGGPAQAAGLRRGDVIEAINGVPPFIDGQLTQAAAAQLYSATPGSAAVRLQLYRPATGTRWTAALTPAPYRPDPAATQLVTSRLLPDNAAYVRLAGFQADGATQVLAAISALRTGRNLTGVVLDLRGNHGGDPVLVDQLLGAFTHGKVTAYQCTVRGHCDSDRTDDSVALLHLPLVVLTDRGCASACEHFSSAVKDLHLGTLVGTRTAGAIAGLAIPHALSNGTGLSMPARHHLGPNREIIDQVGVAPDHYVPLTAQDLSTGKDPAVAAAMDLLHK